jgi:hypothetical protein
MFHSRPNFMFHSGLIVKQGLTIKLGLFIDSETQFYVLIQSYCQTWSVNRQRDPISVLIPAWICNLGLVDCWESKESSETQF